MVSNFSRFTCTGNFLRNLLFWTSCTTLVAFIMMLTFGYTNNMHRRNIIAREGFSGWKKSTGKNSSKGPPVIVDLFCGGLGNQLFQYSAGFSLAKKHNSDLYICVEEVEARRNMSTDSSRDRTYVLDHFKIPQVKILWTPDKKKDCSFPSEYSPTANYDIFNLHEYDVIRNSVPNDTILKMSEDCFESEVYFKDVKDELLPLFELKNEPMEPEAKEILKSIQNTESVAVHVRRGDYATYSKNHNWILPVSYYVDALKFMSEILHNQRLNTSDKGKPSNITYFVFSDDINYIRNEFIKTVNGDDIYHMVFVSNQNFTRVNDFRFMKSCKHFIVANSTFSWWAAYLSKNINKVIIAPMPRFKPPFVQTHKFEHEIYESVFNGIYSYPENWITVNPNFQN